MKKILLGTTAVVALASLSTEALAADPISLKLGGFMRHYIAVTNHDEVAAGTGGAARAVKLGQRANSEVYFRGNTTLDNGLKVTVDVQREADKGNNGNDISSLAVSSDAMGVLTVGATTHAADDFLVGAPNAGNHAWNDLGKVWGMRSDAAGTASTAFTYSANDMTDMGNGKGGKLKYVTPSFSGLSAFASYTANEAENSQISQATRSANQDGYTYGLAYQGELSGVKVSSDLAHANTNTSFSNTHFGLNVGMAGFTVGGGYSDFNDTRAARSDLDGNAWDLGVGYKTGPYAVSAGYTTSKNKGTTATAGDNKDTQWALSATYDMGAGVKLNATGYRSKADAEGNGTTFATGKSASVSGVIAGIEVGF